MGVKIKTAWEKAMERFEEKNKNVSPEDIRRMECRQDGFKLVGRYLAEPELRFGDALREYASKERELVLQIVVETLITRLVLPEDEQGLENNRRVMEGLLELKQNKKALRPLLGELEHLFNYYLQTREQARGSIEQQFASQIEAVMKRQGLRSGPGARINPETHPQFQEEWSKLLARVKEKFMPALTELRQKIADTE